MIRINRFLAVSILATLLSACGISPGLRCSNSPDRAQCEAVEIKKQSFQVDCHKKNMNLLIDYVDNVKTDQLICSGSTSGSVDKSGNYSGATNSVCQPQYVKKRVFNDVAYKTAFVGCMRDNGYTCRKDGWDPKLHHGLLSICR